MSNSVEKVVDKLPDVLFDWYARFLPGCLGVGIYMYLSPKFTVIPSGGEIVLYLFAGYMIGHILQPIASFLVRQLAKLICDEDKYTKAQHAENPNIAMISLVKKAYAEAVSMFLMLLVILMNWIWFHADPRVGSAWWWAAAAYFLGATIERIVARRRKISKLPCVK